ncbi:hypothetical protein, partial [Klebsiella pneumoniae]|uniref:hypothetical protein n=1 Tax=Klebsiella pneumoniae TaxID=573 RepID=UPI00263B7013
MKAEEILKKHLDKHNVIITKMYVGYLYDAMKEYADQNNNELKLMLIKHTDLLSEELYKNKQLEE